METLRLMTRRVSCCDNACVIAHNGGCYGNSDVYVFLYSYEDQRLSKKCITKFTFIQEVRLLLIKGHICVQKLVGKVNKVNTVSCW